MKDQQHQLHEQLQHSFPGLVRMARIMTSTDHEAEQLIHRAARNGLAHTKREQPKRLHFFKSLIRTADESQLPFKRQDYRMRLHRLLDHAMDESSGSAVNDAVKGDMYGWGDVADLRRQVDESADRPNLDGLSPMTRIILQLKLQEGFSYDDIADICDLSRDEVRKFLMLGRRTLVNDIVRTTLSDTAPAVSRVAAESDAR